METGANRQLHRQSSQKLNDRIGSQADQFLPNLTTKPLDHIALAIEKLANKNSPQSPFHPKKSLTFNEKNEKTEKLQHFSNHFHAHFRGLALKIFKNLQRTPNTTSEEKHTS